MSKKCKIKESPTLKVHGAYTSTSSHNDLYWDTERNKDPWKPASPKFGWHLDQITSKITRNSSTAGYSFNWQVYVT